MVVDVFRCFGEALYAYAREDWSEDFLLVNSHLRRYVVEKQTTHKEALLAAWQLQGSDFNDQVSAFFDTCRDADS